MLWLERTLGRNTDVIRLVLRQHGELRIKLLQVKSSYLLVERLRQCYYLFTDGLRIGIELNLGQGLVRERR